MAARVAVGQAAAFLLGFALAQTVVFEDYVPFGVAATAAARREYIVATALGAIGGSFLSVGAAGGFRIIAAIFAAAAIRMLISGIFRVAKGAPFSAVVAFACVMCTGLVVMTVQGASTTGVILYLSEGMLSGGAAYFFRRTVTLEEGFRPAGMSSQDLTCWMITVAIVMLSLVPFRIGFLSPARVVVAMAVLFAARYGREMGGAFAGIAAGLVISLSSESLSFAAASFAFGGLMAGVFAPMGAVGCALAFTVSNGLFALAAIDSLETLHILYEIMAASVLSLAMPLKWSAKIAERISPRPEVPDADGLKKSVVMHLRFASDALRDVSQTVEQVSEKLQRISLPGIDTVLAQTEETACRNCGMRVYCWETARGETLDALVEASKQLRRRDKLSPELLPREFMMRCAHPERVLDTLQDKFTSFLSQEAAERRVSEIRSVVSEQFDGISDMLSDMASELEESRHYDALGAARIDDALRAAGIIPVDLSCSVDRFGRMTAEIRLDAEGSERANRAILMRELSHACGRDFDVPCMTEIAGGKLLTISEKAALCVDFGVAQHACGDNRLCGDAYEYFSDGKGRSVMILSDGMGQGGRAAVDGAMASGLMARLVKAGFGFDCALNIVNSAMLFKSGDESLATIDVACIDLFNGHTDFFKAGAPATILRRGGKVSCAEGASLPAGILKEVRFDHSSATLSRGDIVLMVSDGVVADGMDWIGVELEVWKNGSASQLAEHIADYARRRRQCGKEDDITVLAAIIEKGV